ncbi:unnamed protein product, partial [Prorocentrum cordatum]
GSRLSTETLQVHSQCRFDVAEACATLDGRSEMRAWCSPCCDTDQVCSDEGLASRASVVILGPTLSVSPQGVGVGRLRSGTAGRPPAFPRSSAGVRVKRQDDLAGVHAAHLQLKNAFDDVEEKLGPAAGSADPPGSPQLEERPETSVSEGATYAGQWKGSLRHGQGVLKGADGQRYHGSFRNGQVHGHGVFKAASGNTYEGQWELSKRHGRGKYVHMDGITYEGEWKLDMKSGYGVEQYSDSARYEGQFAFGCKHGAGTYTSGLGVTYQGQFKEDKMDGQGTYEFADGRTKYVGQWSDGHMKGSGRMTWPSGSMYKGQYEFRTWCRSRLRSG